MKQLALAFAVFIAIGGVFGIGYYAGTRHQSVVPSVMAASVLTNPDNVSGTWQLNANGSTGTLLLNQDVAGSLTGLVNTGGTTFGQFLIGFYSKSDGRLVFLRVIPDFSDPTRIVERTAGKSQVFMGNAFTSSRGTFITGTFFNFSPQASDGGASASQFNFGWFGQK